MEIFICYPRELQKDAKKVAAFFRSVKVPYWLDIEKLVAGEKWDRHRKESLRSANAVLIVCGHQLNDRDGIYHREINEALSHLNDKRLEKLYIFPARSININLPSELAEFQYVNLFEDDWEGQLAKGLAKLHEQDGVTSPPELEVAAAVSMGEKPQLETISETDGDFAFNAEWPVYPSLSHYWRYVNSEIQSPIYRLYFQRKKWFFEGDIAIPFSSADISVTEFFRNEDVISLVVNESIYSGGAHPSHSVFTINILGDGFGRLQFHELFIDPPKTCGYLADYVNLISNSQDERNFDIR